MIKTSRSSSARKLPSRAQKLARAMLPLALAAFLASPAPVGAGERLTLRAEVLAQRDVITLADLVEGEAGALADKPLFRSPALGETGTIQARRVAEAAAHLGLVVETAGQSQVVIQRAARRVGAAEIEAVVKQALELQHGIDARALSIAFDGPPPAFVVAPEATGALVAEAVAFDPRTRRLGATVVVPGPGGERRPGLRVAGTAAEFVEVAVLNRAIGRGEAVSAADLTVERRVKDGLPADAQSDLSALLDRVARRALGAGSVVRVGDLARPEIVGRGEMVTVVYEAPGLLLTLRGRAIEAGAQGETIAVTNLQTKKTLQARVVAPGKVSVSAGLPGRVAIHAAPARP